MKYLQLQKANPSLFILTIALLISQSGIAFAQQTLTLKNALELGVNNYGIIKAKTEYAAASKTGIEQAKRDYLPNFNVSAQTDYGTANGQNGPLYGFGGLGLGSGGIPLATQNFNAAFGSLLLTSVNWDFFAFGRSKEKIKTASAIAERDEKDKQQEVFQEQIRVSAAYLNLLAAQRLTSSYQKNLDRADTLRNIIVVKAKHDLVAGVDSSEANAEVSNARSTLIKAMDFEEQQAANLIQLLGISPQKLNVDTFFISRLPGKMPAADDSLSGQHPLLQFYRSRVSESQQQAIYYHTFNYPTFTLEGGLQTRGSGFSSSYTAQQSAYTDNFYSGIKPERTNYLIGVGVTWNLTQPLRISQQVKSQRLISGGLQDEYLLARQQLASQLSLSDSKIKNAIADYKEVPFQVKAATDAYNQKTVQYKNGLTSLVDVTQALYALVRSETDRDIAYNNVWQALLLKAAAEGDFSLFYQNL
jgi:outer membrane protein TolC